MATLKLKLKPKATPAPTSATAIVSSVVVSRKPKIEVFAPPKAPPKAVKPPAPTPKAVKKPKPAPVQKPKIVQEIDPTPRPVRIEQTLTIMKAEFPHLFPEAEADILPFAIGIRQEIREILRGKKAEGKFRSGALIAAAIGQWKEQHPVYGELLKVAGTPRRGLDGQIKGEVTEKEAARAIKACTT